MVPSIAILTPTSGSRQAQPAIDSLLAWYARQFVTATTAEQRTRIALVVRNDGYTGVEFRSAIAAAEQAR